MIKNKDDLNVYLKKDKIALGIDKETPSFFGDEIWKFEIELRYGEYLINCKPLMWKLRLLYSRFKKHYLSILCCGYEVPYNVVGEGLALIHRGPIIINSSSRIGSYCRIHSGVTIGATSGEKKAPTIGDNVYIGSGAKVIGNINIGSNCAIGAGAVVVKSVPDSVTVGGVPARIISNNTSSRHIPSCSQRI
ncbi:MAG: serine acetyltransferase [Bacteroidota bacterium]|nr:serine acetyltransferase [Bacteroidota bacterium]